MNFFRCCLVFSYPYLHIQRFPIYTYTSSCNSSSTLPLTCWVHKCHCSVISRCYKNNYKGKTSNDIMVATVSATTYRTSKTIVLNEFKMGIMMATTFGINNLPTVPATYAQFKCDSLEWIYEPSLTRRHWQCLVTHTHPMNQPGDIKSMHSWGIYGRLVMSAIPKIVHSELDARGISSEQMLGLDTDLRSVENRW